MVNTNKGDNMHEIDLKNYKIRTDLIVEQIDKDDKNIIKKERKYSDINVLEITLEEDNKELLKDKGTYITISFNDVTDTQNRKNLEKVLVEELKVMLSICKINKDAKGLIVGLGNLSSTPDSLGPKVASSILVTRHLFELDGINVEEGYRNVSSFTPGVMGNTGIESSDIIKGIIDSIKPDFVIAIDALASSSIDRVNKTIQLTSTGINPGSGVGNSRKELSEKTLGIPVIAIGIPTVVDAVTIVSDTINYLKKIYSYNIKNIDKAKTKLSISTSKKYIEEDDNLTEEQKEQLLGLIGNLDDEEMKELILEVLTPIGYNMMVTPKEIDFIIDKLSVVIRDSINKGLHQKLVKDI